jgi:hypothetical protein
VRATVLRSAGLIAALAVLAACASRPPQPLAPAPDPHDSDPSYDWQVLLIVPMGSVLKSIPVPLHEALLFRDEGGGAPADDGECYAPDSPAPRFLGAVPEDYLLCFKQDRLARIRAAVQLSAASAQGIFDTACVRWQRDGLAAEAEPPGARTATDGQCAGRRGAVRYSARLGTEPSEPDGGTAPHEAGPSEPATDAQKDSVFIVLDGAPDT